MPPLIDEQIRRKVIRQWITGIPRDTIAAENNIGAGTVSSIIANYKTGLDDLDFDSIRQLAVEARQHGWNLSELASHARLYNYFIKSGAAENKVESFITKFSSNNIPSETVIELVYQLHESSKQESIPLDQVPEYIKQKLEAKQKIDEDVKQADAILQSKNVSIEAINEVLITSSIILQYGYSQTTTGGISVLSSSSFRDDTGAYHIVSEVKNNSPTESMNYVKILATVQYCYCTENRLLFNKMLTECGENEDYEKAAKCTRASIFQ